MKWNWLDGTSICFIYKILLFVRVATVPDSQIRFFFLMLFFWAQQPLHSVIPFFIVTTIPALAAAAAVVVVVVIVHFCYLYFMRIVNSKRQSLAGKQAKKFNEKERKEGKKNKWQLEAGFFPEKSTEKRLCIFSNSSSIGSRSGKSQ